MEQDHIVQELDSVEFVRSSDGKVFSTVEDLIADEKLHEEDNNQFDFLFNNDSIRYFIKDNIVWFIGKDICDYLEYTNSKEAIRDHVSPTNAMHFSYNEISAGLAQIRTVANCYGSDSQAISHNGALCINEQGIYELTRFSQMPKANEFYTWIHNRVLPNIRRTGTYMTPNTTKENILIMEVA